MSLCFCLAVSAVSPCHALPFYIYGQLCIPTFHFLSFCLRHFISHLPLVLPCFSAFGLYTSRIISLRSNCCFFSIADSFVFYVTQFGSIHLSALFTSPINM